MLKNLFARIVLLSCCVLTAGLAMGGSMIDKISFERRADQTQLILNLNAPAQYRISTMANPERLVIDIHDTRLRFDLANLSLQDAPVKRARSGVRNGSDTRLVLELSEAVKARGALLSGDGQGHRLVIDLVPRNAPKGKTIVEKTVEKTSIEKTSVAKTRTAKTVKKTETIDTEVRVAKTVKSADSDGRRDVVIAIDAGHGGDDPGAIGPGRLQEKRIALAIAKELAAIFERERGYKAVLTRNGDYFLPLKTRRDLARKAQADLMVSVHADAFSDRDAQGGSVFALSNRGATSTMAAFLAASENEADAIGGVSTEGKDDDLVKVLADLSVTATMESSLRIGRHVLNAMGGVAKLHTNRVEQAAFVVLKSPDTPSILVETGFVSNPQEARRLASSDYQQKIAQAIFKGVNRHFSQNPPPNTYLAWLKRNGKPVTAADALASVEP
jgi:N-acetylmuramoyl-L-alanine amidase